MLSHISWIVASIAGHRCERIAAYGASDNVEAVKAGGGRPSSGRLYGGSVFGSRCACTCGGTQQMAHPIAMPGIEEELLCSIFPSIFPVLMQPPERWRRPTSQSQFIRLHK